MKHWDGRAAGEAKLLDTVLDTMDQGAHDDRRRRRRSGLQCPAAYAARFAAGADADPPEPSRPSGNIRSRRGSSRGVRDLRRWVAARGLSARPTTYERERPNGTVLEIRTVPLPDGGAVRTFTDITARKRPRRRCRSARRRLALAQDAGSDGLWDCDLTTGRRGPRIAGGGCWATSPASWRATQTWRACSTRRCGRGRAGPDRALSGRAPTFACRAPHAAQGIPFGPG